MDIHNAACDGNLNDVCDSIRRGGDVNSVDEGGWTPLLLAANGGHTDCVKELFSSRAVLDKADNDGWTPLLVAARRGHTESVKELLSSGAVVDLADKLGYTPLCWAARNGHTDCVRVLLSKGAMVNLAGERGWTPLWGAASGGHTGCVRELLSSEAILDLADKDGYTPLMLAAYNGQEDTVKELLSSGASIISTNKRGQTALMLAKESLMLAKELGFSKIIQLLEEAAGAHVLPRSWTIVTDTETKTPIYQNETTGETLLKLPGYPLHQTSAHPGVAFYDEPREKVFTSSGGHADFANGVKVAVPANAIPVGTSVGIKVQPSLAPIDVFVMPEGIQSASPSYLISSEGINGQVTVSMEHYVRVSTQEEAGNLLFLQADSSPKRSGSKSVYEYREVRKGSSQFTPGGNTGKLTRRLSKKRFIKIGRQARVRDSPPNLYTVRVYLSPPHTTGDRMALVIISYFQRLFHDFLRKFEVDVIPRDYPHLSNSPADKTIKNALSFIEVDAVLELVCDSAAWRSVPNQTMISQREVDLPMIGKFSREKLHDYPPRIVCRFFPEQGAVSTTCTLSLHGFDTPVSVNMALEGFDKPVSVNMALLTPQRSVDTKQLKEATEVLRRTVSEITTTSQLGPSVESVLSLMEKMATALQSSSLSELAALTDSIRTEIESVLVVTRRVVEDCTLQSENIGANLSKIDDLSRQFCMVARAKRRHCQDQSEEAAALVDLVENGANLLRAVDLALREIDTLSGNTGYSVLMSCSEMIVQSLSEDPKALALHLMPAGIITVSILEATNELNETKREKATRLYTALIGVVKHHPHKYDVFVSTLRRNPLHTDLVRELDSKCM